MRPLLLAALLLVACNRVPDAPPDTAERWAKAEARERAAFQPAGPEGAALVQALAEHGAARADGEVRDEDRAALLGALRAFAARPQLGADFCAGDLQPVRALGLERDALRQPDAATLLHPALLHARAMRQVGGILNFLVGAAMSREALTWASAHGGLPPAEKPLAPSFEELEGALRREAICSTNLASGMDTDAAAARLVAATRAHQLEKLAAIDGAADLLALERAADAPELAPKQLAANPLLAAITIHARPRVHEAGEILEAWKKAQ